MASVTDVLMLNEKVLDGSRRISRHDLYMNIAILVSLRGTCIRARVGAVIVRDGRILSIGYVGSPPGDPHCLDVGCEIDEKTGGCIRTVHAEQNAILWAAQSGISVKGGTLYTTLSPCLNCAKAIHMSGIVDVFYLEAYRDPSGIDFLTKHKITPRQIVGVE